MICPNCGKEIKEATVCPACGAIKRVGRRQAAMVAKVMHNGNTVRNSVDELPRRAPAVRRNNSLNPATIKGQEQRPRATAQEPLRPSRLEADEASSVLREVDHDAQTENHRSARSMGSMPQTERLKEAQSKNMPPLRMVQHKPYQPIGSVPERANRFNWIRMSLVSFVCIAVMTVGVYLFLSQSDTGQFWLASMGRDASMDAYRELGRRYMVEGSIFRAIRAFEIAQSKAPNDLEILIDLGKAYRGNNQVKEAELAFTRAIQFWPAYSEPYRLIIDMMQEQGRNYEASQCVQLAIEKTEDEYFSNLYNQLIPSVPDVEKLNRKGVREFARGGRFEDVFTIWLTCDESNGEKIFYTLLGEDPIKEGKEYTEEEKEEGILLDEGAWRLRAVAMKDEMYSDEQVQSYSINKPIPDMPKSRLPSGTYDTQRSVALYASKDTVIYYTTDGTAPTIESTKYTEPFTLRIGKTTVRAIAVNIEGKISNEFSVDYDCKVRTKTTTMSEKDVIDDLVLNKTTKAAFIKTYGEPSSEAADGKDGHGSYIRLVYPFGHAVFLDKGGDKEPVLVELSTKSSAFVGPRKTGVGIRMEDILGAFRDSGGDANEKGERVLYTMTDGRLAIYNDLGDNLAKVSYYLKLDTKLWIELSYYFENGLVEHMEWLRYYTE